MFLSLCLNEGLLSPGLKRSRIEVCSCSPCNVNVKVLYLVFRTDLIICLLLSEEATFAEKLLRLVLQDYFRAVYSLSCGCS